MTRPALIEDRAYWIEYANELEQQIEELETTLRDAIAPVEDAEYKRWVQLLWDFDSAYGKDKRYGELAQFIERLAQEKKALLERIRRMK